MYWVLIKTAKNKTLPSASTLKPVVVTQPAFIANRKTMLYITLP